MRYCQLGKTGLRVSKLGFGTMRLPIPARQPDFTSAMALIRHAVGCGINLFDVGTFYCHGHCERAFGLALEGISTNGIVACGKNATHQSRDPDWSSQLDRTRRLLGWDRLDLYFLHNLHLKEWRSWFLERGIYRQVQRAQQNGVIRHLGFSSHDTPENVKTLIDTDLFAAVILPYNLIRREYEAVMIHAHRKELGVMVMNPLAGGALADQQRFHPQRDFPESPPLPMPRLALNYVLSQPFVHTVLSGMETMGMIDANVTISDGPRFSPPQIKALNDQVASMATAATIPCTACGYCHPCTQGIEIPRVIQIVNLYAAAKTERLFAREYAMLDPGADTCIQCGTCLERCPNHIDIPDIMAQAVARFPI